MTDFDKTVRPQDDFFGYVNNKWIKDNPIPDDEKWWSNWNVLRNKVNDAIDEIVRDLSSPQTNELTHSQKLLKDFFNTALHYSDYAKNNLASLENELNMINNITNKNQLERYLGYSHIFASTFWDSYVSIDDKDSTNQLLFFAQGGLSLPNRDYYLEKSKDMIKVRKEYGHYYNAMKKRFPKYIKSDFSIILNIEKKLARSSWTEAKLRDPKKNYHKFEISDLSIKYPGFNWQEYFSGLTWDKPNCAIVIGQPDYIEKCLKILQNESLKDIKSYLKWRLLDCLNTYIDEQISREQFNFYGKIIDGKKEMQPLWKRIIQTANRLIIGEALGREYINRYFSESSKNDVNKIVENIRSAYHIRIDQLDWLSSGTKQIAHKKLNNIKVLIGYPSKWENLAKLKFSDNNYLENILNTWKFMHKIDIAKINKKPATEEWHMNAHTVNAYFSSSRLEICFPAGVLQPPFYDQNANYATNLGGIGAIVGHELTHGFDDQGAEVDEFGNLKKWQKTSEQKKFKRLALNLEKQADNFEVLPGTYLDGKLVLGEAIADIGGFDLALECLKNHKSDNNFDELAKELFINYAVVECATERNESLLQSAKNDPHPPGEFRVNSTLSNIDMFYSIYDVKPGDKLYLPPEQRVHIW